jgi:histidyl-tRNA synthetase
LATAYRRAGFSAEVIATGSPKKRYDRARKLDPAMIVSLDVREGVLSRNIKPLNEAYARSAAAHDVFEAYFA